LIKDVGKKSNIVQRGFIYLIKSFEKLSAVKNSTNLQNQLPPESENQDRFEETAKFEEEIE